MTVLKSIISLKLCVQKVKAVVGSITKLYKTLKFHNLQENHHLKFEMNLLIFNEI